MKNINTTTSFSLSPVSTKWYHPPSKHPHHYYTTTKRVVGASFLPVTPEEPWCQPDTSIYVPCTCVCVKKPCTHTGAPMLKVAPRANFFFKVPLNGNYAPRWTLDENSAPSQEKMCDLLPHNVHRASVDAIISPRPVMLEFDI